MVLDRHYITDIPAIEIKTLDTEWLSHVNTSDISYTKLEKSFEGNGFASDYKGFVEHDGQEYFIKFFTDEGFMKSTERVMRALQVLNLTPLPDFNFNNNISQDLLTEDNTFDIAEDDIDNIKGAMVSRRIYVDRYNVIYGQSLPQSSDSTQSKIDRHLITHAFAETLMTIGERNGDNYMVDPDNEALWSIDHDGSLGYHFLGTAIPLDTHDKETRYDDIMEVASREFSEEFSAYLQDLLPRHHAHRIGLRVKAKFKELKDILKPEEFDLIQNRTNSLLADTRDDYLKQRKKERQSTLS